MASDFRKRVLACLRRGHLTKADLQHWLGCPYPTIHSWIDEARAPGPVSVHRFEPRLKLLEAVLRGGRHFPVPMDVGHRDRPAYILGVRHEFERGKGSRA